MPRELVVMLWCDPCAAEDLQESGTEHIYAVDGSKEVALVACERHHKEYVAPLLDALEKFGIPASSQPPVPTPAKGLRGARKTPLSENARGPRKCAICEIVFGVDNELKNAESLASHRNNTHHVSAMAYRALARGDATVVSSDRNTWTVELEVPPLPPKDDPTYVIPADYVCGVDDCTSVFDPRDYEAGEDGAYRAVTGHRKASHKAAA